MASAIVVGSTGLVGSRILNTLLQEHSSIHRIYTISRRAPEPNYTTLVSESAIENTSAKTSKKIKIREDDPKNDIPTTPDSERLHCIISVESSEWPTKLSQLNNPSPDIMFSALGTTRAAAGSAVAQNLIDYDLNLSLASSAQKAGVRVYVLISSSGANANSMLHYPKMKGKIEEAIKALGFETLVIVRPGLLLGEREQGRFLEFIPHKVAGIMSLIGFQAIDFWAQDATTVARATVSAGLTALKGKSGSVWEIGQSEIVRLGRIDWKSS